MLRSRSGSLSRSRRRSDSLDDSSSANVGRQQQARRRRDSTVTLLLGSLKDSLPGRLSQSPLFDGKNPELILQRQSPHQDRGFKVTMWREADQSTVLLENAAADGSIPQDAKVDLQQVRDMVEELGRPANDTNDGIPHQIAVRTNGSTQSRLAARQMIQDVLQAAGDENKRYVLKEGEPVTLNPLPVGGVDNPITQVGLTFSVTRQTMPDRIIDRQAFVQNMGGPPRDDLKIEKGFIDITVREKSKLYKDILEKYDAFQNTLAENDAKTQEVEKRQFFDSTGIPIDADSESLKRNKEILDAADDLIVSLNKYIADSSTVRKDARREEKDRKKDEVKKLSDQVVAAKADGFKRELDEVRFVRWQALQPLTESQIIPGTERVIGSGAQGDVKAARLLLNDGATGEFALKANQKGLNQEARNAGIPEDNPQQSARAGAAYKINQRLGFDVIPRTEFMVLSDAEGRPQLGQALQFVNGSIGQRKGPGRDRITDAGEIEQAELRYKRVTEGVEGGQDAERVENAKFDLENKWNYRINGGEREWYRVRDLPVDINYNDPAVQEGLADLQLFDAIIGHADRHAENFIYQKDDAGKIIGVKGLDNDDSLGAGWSPKRPNDPTTSKTPGVPPIISVDAALKVLRISNFDEIRGDMTELSPAERDAAVSRLWEVRQGVKQRVRDNQIATKDEVIDFDTLVELGRLAGLDDGVVPTPKTWGDVDVNNSQTENNSYLGNILAMKQANGTVPEQPMRVNPDEPGRIPFGYPY